MNIHITRTEAMRRGASSPRFAMSALSAAQMHEICVFGCTANDALALIAQAAQSAREQGGALDPESLLAFLADNNLMLDLINDNRETSDAQHSAA